MVLSIYACFGYSRLVSSQWSPFLSKRVSYGRYLNHQSPVVCFLKKKGNIFAIYQIYTSYKAFLPSTPTLGFCLAENSLWTSWSLKALVLLCSIAALCSMLMPICSPIGTRHLAR